MQSQSFAWLRILVKLSFDVLTSVFVPKILLENKSERKKCCQHFV